MSKWRTTYDDPDDSDDEEKEDWQSYDDDPIEDDCQTSELDDEDDGTDPCPYCNQPVHHLAIYCPYCENYLSKESEPQAKEPNWIRWGFILTFIVVILWVLNWA